MAMTDDGGSVLDRKVDGFGDLAMGTLVAESRAARHEDGDGFDVHRYLADRGHTWQTVETVLAYLTVPEVTDQPTRRRS